MAVKTFELNGKKIKAKEFEYDLVCDLEALGVDIDALGTKPMNALRGYVAVCTDTDLKTAGKLINKHATNGGALDGIVNIMAEQMENSGFFQGLLKATQTEVTEN